MLMQEEYHKVDIELPYITVQYSLVAKFIKGCLYLSTIAKDELVNYSSVLKTARPHLSNSYLPLLLLTILEEDCRCCTLINIPKGKGQTMGF